MQIREKKNTWERIIWRSWRHIIWSRHRRLKVRHIFMRFFYERKLWTRFSRNNVFWPGDHDF